MLKMEIPIGKNEDIGDKGILLSGEVKHPRENNT